MTIIKQRNAVLILLATSFWGGSNICAADSTGAADSSSVGVGTLRHRNLQEPSLQTVFSARGAPLSPLAECQGDCDNDNHCAGDLVCFQRYVY